jgi:hypothetical protein
MRNLMADPDNHTLRLPRELRDAIASLDNKITSLDNKVDRNHEEVRERFDSLRKLMAGESVLGRYATAEFEERIAAIEERLLALEHR